MDTELPLLRLVFSFHVVDQILNADERIDPAEAEWMRERFPLDELSGHGLVDAEHRLTDRYRELLSEALIRLPAELGDAEKVALVLTFFESALADGDYEPREDDALRAAAQLLGLSMERVFEALDEHDDVGHVELDEAE